MKWILIVAFFASSSSTPSLTTIKFESGAECAKVADEIRTTLNDVSRGVLVSKRRTDTFNTWQEVRIKCVRFGE